MKYIIILLICSNNLLSQVIDDKFLHHQTSALISGAASIISFKLFNKPVKGILFSIGGSIGLGYCKERFYDGMLKKGHEDYKGDFVQDINGSITGGFFAGMSIVIKMNEDSKIRKLLNK